MLASKFDDMVTDVRVSPVSPSVLLQILVPLSGILLPLIVQDTFQSVLLYKDEAVTLEHDPEFIFAIHLVLAAQADWIGRNCKIVLIINKDINMCFIVRSPIGLNQINYEIVPIDRRRFLLQAVRTRWHRSKNNWPHLCWRKRIPIVIRPDWSFYTNNIRFLSS